MQFKNIYLEAKIYIFYFRNFARKENKEQIFELAVNVFGLEPKKWSQQKNKKKGEEKK